MSSLMDHSGEEDDLASDDDEPSASRSNQHWAWEYFRKGMTKYKQSGEFKVCRKCVPACKKALQGSRRGILAHLQNCKQQLALIRKQAKEELRGMQKRKSDFDAASKRQKTANQKTLLSLVDRKFTAE
ncbi:hypothetical protein BV898_19850 [Hypsibius exemplaris]|uniref:Uncharacterized protein n=1 Tax=Hypsibius exemplaris TaxID=2072580 RepID=A0A9X6NMA3_HYPEX|nr:hypothetical protein BV898_19850 [Hypsibius exemplaris]